MPRETGAPEVFGMAESAKLLMQGEQAMRTVATLMKRAHPTNIPGHDILRPGTIWMGDKMLVYADQMRACATVGDRLYEWSIGDWFREADFQGLRKAADSAKVWCVLSEIEMGVLCEVIAPWYLLLGLTGAKVGLFCHENRRELGDALEVAPRAMSLLVYVKRKYPLLCKTLAKGAIKDVLVGLKDQVISKEHIASFLADLIKDLTEDPELAIGQLATLLGRVAFTTVVRKGWKGMVARSAIAAADRRGTELVAYMNQVGYKTTVAEANAFTQELAADPAAPAKLHELDSTLRALLPLLKKLQEEKEETGGAE